MELLGDGMRGSFALHTVIALAAASVGRAPTARAQMAPAPVSNAQLTSTQSGSVPAAGVQAAGTQAASGQTPGGTIVWRTVDPREHGTALAIGDVHREFASGTYGFWQKIVSPEGSYSIRLVETDCANARERDIIVVRYSRAPERALAEYSTDPSRWRPILPATLGDSAFHAECRSVGHPAP
jgi:hypothetical protein